MSKLGHEEAVQRNAGNPPWFRLAFMGVAVLAIGGWTASPYAQQTAPSAAVDGAKLYAQKCATCHGAQFQGAHGPALTGKTFAAVWKGRTARNLYTKIRLTMPIAEPGTLTERQAVAITNHILAGSKIKPAKKPTAAADLAAIQLTFP